MPRRSFVQVLLDSLSDATKGGSWGAIGSTRKERELGHAALHEVLNRAVDNNGRLKYQDGFRERHGNTLITVNSASDPEAPGGYYLSIVELNVMGWPIAKTKYSIVFDANGFIADTRSNRKGGWI